MLISMINNLGFYVQADGDVGDASHRTGLAMGIKYLLGDKEDAYNLYWNCIYHLEVSSGLYIRHPEGYRPDWSNNPRAFSRDQASRLIFGYATSGRKDVILRWIKVMASRGFLHQNDLDPTTNEKKFRDVMGPGEFRNIIRGLDLWYLYPVLLILDLLFIPDIYLRSKWDGASLYVPDLKFALKKYWTPFAWIANKLNNRTTWLDEALHNHSLEKNGCVELQDLFIKLAKEIN